MTEAIKYLEEFVKVAKSAHLSRSLVDACVFLGDIYNEKVSIVIMMMQNSWFYFRVKT